MADETVSLWVRMEAKPGREDDVQAFLESGRGLVDDEPDTTTWFAVRLGGSSFDAFPDDGGRDAHLNGRVAEALMAQADDLFSEPPSIEKADVIALKHG